MGTPSQRDSATNVCFSVSGKHIRFALSRRHGSAEGGGVVLDTSFGDEFGRDHFGHTPTVKFKKGYVKEESFSIDTLKRWEVYE
ncbi:hypothetical protein IGI04_030532 [Brassica rapa subsp. trilocularis]|uniref:TLDc domain-containing protein n=1 Tax=Brassica rapa subsp. trilocularis TaxID=1813537 RepID=A0ABQ7LTD7_BRACM|nr:hypothetical protein IGI04_030532 [Brassica rapa subsp. trilocularis]